MSGLFDASRHAEPLILRPYQETAVNECRRAISEWIDVKFKTDGSEDLVRRRVRPVLSCPTGGGKTLVAASIFTAARAKRKTCAFVVPLLSLIPQTYRSFERAGMDHIGVIQGDNPLSDSSAPVQICSIQTVGRRLRPQADVVIFDEIHTLHQAHVDWMAEADPGTVFIGLSATPWRKGLADHFDRMIVVETTAGLISRGFLSPYRAFASATPDLSNVKIVAGDYHEGQLGEAMNKPKLVADVVTTWLEKAERRKTLVFAVNCAHAQALQKQFLDAGVRAGYVDAYTKVEGVGGREEMIEQLRTGELEVICNVGTMTTGVDAPFVSCLVLARPTRSEMLFVQIVGRGLRTCDGRDDCLIFDHSDTIARLGLPDEIHYDSFPWEPAEEAEAAKRKEALPKACPQCAYLKPPRTLKCPCCGFETAPASKIQCAEGELSEVGSKRKPKEQADMETKQKWLSGLIFIARERGYKDGWASRKYMEKFGVWPHNTMHKSPRYPDAVVSGWVRSRQIAWAKAKAAAEGKTQTSRRDDPLTNF